MNTAWKFFRKICSVAVMLALVAGIAVIPIQAAPNGIYLASAHAHYKHPVTGQVEDSGGSSSSVLGQSMTESALYPQALVEVDSTGNTFVTIRLQLMDNIQNPQFQTAQGSGSFTPVTATLMQEDAASHTADYRMKVPDENAIIRCNMHIIAMGRDVIFYITLSDLSSGSGDFVTSIEVAAPAANRPDSGNTPAEPQTSQAQMTQAQTASGSVAAEQSHVSQNPVTAGTSEIPQGTEPSSGSRNDVEEPLMQTTAESDESGRTDPEEGADRPEENVYPEAETESQSVAEETAVPEETTVQDETETTGKKKKAQGIEEFDKDGKEVSTGQTEKQTEEKKNTSKIAVGAGILVVLAAGVGVYVVRYRKKKGD